MFSFLLDLNFALFSFKELKRAYQCGNTLIRTQFLFATEKDTIC